MSLAWNAYRLLAPCAGALAPAARWLASAPERALWDERLGRVAVEPAPHAWLHAASLGEAVAARALVAELRARQPAARLHLTATTRTGRTRLRELDPAASLAPLDAPQAAQRFFAMLQPRRLFLIETELWPQWLMRARTAAVPVAVVSARLSAESSRRYRWMGAGLRELVRGIDAVLCQSVDDRERWLDLGVRGERAEVVGNLKIDALPAPAADRAAARGALGLAGKRPLLVLGSLRPGEAGALGRAWGALPAGVRERWQVVAVPRHPHASGALREEAVAAGVSVVDDDPLPVGGWRWVDHAGVLGDYYAAAEVAFVGGSLFPFGGHNPLEPAARGAAVIIGPHHGAQMPAVGVLEDANAVVIAATDTLEHTLGLLLSNDELRERHAAAALAAVRSALGATRRAVDRLVEWKLWPVA